MKKIVLIAVIAVASAAFFLRTPNTDPAAMAIKYSNAQSKFVDAETGLRVHYRDQGNKVGPALVLLHGTSASLHTWEPLIERLGTDYRIITLTQPGYGITGPHPEDDYSFASKRDAVNLVVDKLGIDKFVIGGNSMGGWVSWRYAIAHPERVNALILIDAAGAPLRAGETPPPLNLGFRLAANPLGRIILHHFTPRRLVEQSLIDTVADPAFVTDAVIDRYWELTRYPGNRRAMTVAWQADHEDHYADRLGEITAPTLILWGAEDQLIYPSAATTFSERIPHANVIIYEDVGHIPMAEAPDATARDIDAFLNRELVRKNAPSQPVSQ